MDEIVEKADDAATGKDKKAEKKLEKAAEALSKKRQKAAKALGKLVEEELAALKDEKEQTEN